jgi:hypothetical protein
VKYFMQLPYSLKRVAATTALMAPQVKRRVHRDGIAATTKWLNGRKRPSIASTSEAANIAHIAQTVTSRMPGSYNCLTRSLVVWWLVGGDDSATIRFGVSPDQASGFKFHAWVEKGDVVINDAQDVAQSYLPFGDGPPSAADFD